MEEDEPQLVEADHDARASDDQQREEQLLEAQQETVDTPARPSSSPGEIAAPPPTPAADHSPVPVIPAPAPSSPTAEVISERPVSPRERRVAESPPPAGPARHSTTSSSDSPDAARAAPEAEAEEHRFSRAMMERVGVAAAGISDSMSPRRASGDWVTCCRSAAHSLSTFVFHFKRCLGMSPCRYPLQLNSSSSTDCVGGSCGGCCDRCDRCCSCEAGPPAAGRCCAPLVALAFLFITLASLGAQWLRCKHSYTETSQLIAQLFRSHYQPAAGDWAAISRNSSNNSWPISGEYVCQHSYLWLFLLPRLLQLSGYFGLFVCWYCLRQLDIMAFVHWVYDIIAREEAYLDISKLYVRYCQQDRSLLLLTLSASAALSVVSVVVGDGALAGSFPPPEHSGHNLAVFSEVLNCCVVVVFNLLLTYGLMSQLLSLKYYELCLQQVVIHTRALGGPSRSPFITARRFTVNTYERLVSCMRKTQTSYSLVVVLALLQLCGVSVQAVRDAVSTASRTDGAGGWHESLAPLVQPLLHLVALLLYMTHGVRLVHKSYRCHVHCVPAPTTPPVHAPQPPSPADEDEDDDDADEEASGRRHAHAHLISPPGGAGGAWRQQRRRHHSGGRHQGAPRVRSASRTDEQWRSALSVAPLVVPRIFGAQVAPWMFIAILSTQLVMTLSVYMLESVTRVV